MANVRTRGTDKVKVVSAVITLAVIVALVFGIFSVAQNVKKSKNNNLVNLNETEGNVAIKTDDDPDIPVEEPTVGDDDIINANARASMSDDGDGTEDEVTEQTKEPETEEQAVKPMTEAEVMANAISKYTFDQGELIYWPVSGTVTLGYNMDSTVYFKTLGMYKCSPGMVVASDVGTKVCAAVSGVVVDVAENTETGLTVRVAAGNGYEMTTGMLSDVNVKIGDTVTAGQLLGTVAEPTAYYKEEGPGIYFCNDKGRYSCESYGLPRRVIVDNTCKISTCL